MILPDWLDSEAWAGFCEMRKRIRAPLTNRAMTLTINTLERLRVEGYDGNECLDQSTQRSWRGVFATQDRPDRPLVDKHGNKYKISLDGSREYLWH